MSQLQATENNAPDCSDEISLLDLLEILWKKKRLIFGATVLAALISIGVVSTMKRTWESTTDVLVMAPTGAGAPQLSLETLQQLSSSTELLAELLKGVPQSSEGSPSPLDYRQSNFSAKINGTGIPVHFTLSFRASSPEIAQQSALLWPKLFNNHLKTLYTSIGTTVAVQSKLDYEKALKAQENTEKELQNFLKKWSISQMELSLYDFENQHQQLQEQRTETAMELDGIAAQLPPLEKALAELPEQKEKSEKSNNTAISMTEPLDRVLKEQIIQLRVQQAQKASQKKRLQEELDTLTTSMQQLRLDFQAASLTHSKLQENLTIQRELSQRLNTQLQTAQLFTSGENFESLVRVIVPPELPTRPIAPARSRIVILATLAGAFLGILGAFLSHAIDEQRSSLT